MPNGYTDYLWMGGLLWQGAESLEPGGLGSNCSSAAYQLTLVTRVTS